MSIYELDISWIASEDERRHLHWELLACDQVIGVFPSAHDDRLAVLYNGDRLDFRAWTFTLEPETAS